MGSMATEQAVHSIEVRLGKEPRTSSAMRSLVERCRDELTFDEAVSFLEERGCTQNSVFPASTVLGWLVSCGAIEEIRNDAAEGEVGASAEVRFSFKSTEAGLLALDRLSSHEGDVLSSLAADEQEAGVYATVLEACLEPAAKATVEGIWGGPALTDPVRYPGFFMERLEKVGALEWREGWVTTERGRQMLQKLLAR